MSFDSSTSHVPPPLRAPLFFLWGAVVAGARPLKIKKKTIMSEGMTYSVDAGWMGEQMLNLDMYYMYYIFFAID